MIDSMSYNCFILSNLNYASLYLCTYVFLVFVSSSIKATYFFLAYSVTFCIDSMSRASSTAIRTSTSTICSTFSSADLIFELSRIAKIWSCFCDEITSVFYPVDRRNLTVSVGKLEASNKFILRCFTRSWWAREKFGIRWTWFAFVKNYIVFSADINVCPSPSALMKMSGWMLLLSFFTEK